jgi:hypothetical protein
MRNHFKVVFTKKLLRRVRPMRWCIVLVKEHTCSLFRPFFSQCWKELVLQNMEPEDSLPCSPGPVTGAFMTQLNPTEQVSAMEMLWTYCQKFLGSSLERENRGS